MKYQIDVPKAFSVRDEHEFLAFRHLVARLHPHLRVTEAAQGIHKEGGTTKYWGLVHGSGQIVTREELETALLEAGFDHQHNGARINLEAFKII